MAVRHTFWAKLVVVAAISVTGHLVFAQTFNLGSEVGSVGAFVTAIGTLYSVLTAFTVVSVWTEFTDTDRSIKREARQLSELWRYVGYVSDEAGAAAARRSIEKYRDAVVQTEWPVMLQGGVPNTAEDDFFAMADAVNGMGVLTPRDVPAWTEAVRTLGEVSDARSDRILLIAMRMPPLLKVLLLMATTTLIAGMALLGFESEIIGGIVIVLTVSVSLLVLEVINDTTSRWEALGASPHSPSRSSDSHSLNLTSGTPAPGRESRGRGFASCLTGRHRRSGPGHRRSCRALHHRC